MSHRPVFSRRQVVATGAFGAAAAAFLAACGDPGGAGAGRSGTPTSTTEVAPTVPKEPATAAALDEDVTLLRTGTSLELLAAKVYADLGPDLEDATWFAAAARWANDHEDSASLFTVSTERSKRVDKPNAYVLENTVGPVADSLTTDTAILDLFRTIESTLAATYVDAAGTFTTAEWRSKVMTLGSAAARRATLLADGGDGAAPTDALYPAADLISNDAYVLSTPKKADDAG